jgi:hypothetical protein
MLSVLHHEVEKFLSQGNGVEKVLLDFNKSVENTLSTYLTVRKLHRLTLEEYKNLQETLQTVSIKTLTKRIQYLEVAVVEKKLSVSKELENRQQEKEAYKAKQFEQQLFHEQESVVNNFSTERESEQRKLEQIELKDIQRCEKELSKLSYDITNMKAVESREEDKWKQMILALEGSLRTVTQQINTLHVEVMNSVNAVCEAKLQETQRHERQLGRIHLLQELSRRPVYPPNSLGAILGITGAGAPPPNNEARQLEDRQHRVALSRIEELERLVQANTQRFSDSVKAQSRIATELETVRNQAETDARKRKQQIDNTYSELFDMLKCDIDRRNQSLKYSMQRHVDARDVLTAIQHRHATFLSAQLEETKTEQIRRQELLKLLEEEVLQKNRYIIEEQDLVSILGISYVLSIKLFQLNFF